MNLETLISSNAVINTSDVKSKKRALELLADTLAEELVKIPSTDTVDTEEQDSNDGLEIFQLLTDRERLGSTSIGHGVALPHARTNLTSTTIAAFLKLDNGIKFDSPDNKATDLIFALLVPEHHTDEHLKILAYLASLFSDEDFCKTIREDDSKQSIYQHLINWQLTSQAS